MEDAIKSISKYNILNYLIPGTIFCALMRILTPYDLIQSEISVGVFLYYFVGMIISRVGSLVVEPIFKLVGLISYEPYDAYVEASKVDIKIESLSETNNVYRTIIAMSVLLLAAMLTSLIVAKFQIKLSVVQLVLVVLLIVLFVASHRKQTSFVKKRIQLATNKVEDSE